MKKIVFIILAMLLPLLASAATTTFKVDGISYETLEDDNQAVKVINGNTKYSGDVVIPATVTSGGKTYTVKKIGKWAFWECTGLKSIVLPEGLVEIENSSFTGCTGLKALTIPTSVVSIDGTVWSDDMGAFEGCTGLKSIYFPSAMKVSQLYDTNIGGRAFYGCTGLKTIYVAGSETAIAMYDVFGGCTAVTDFVSNIQNPKATYVDVRSFQGFIETANLIVPDGKKSDYQGSNDWYLFKHIYERSSYTKAFAIVKASQGGKVSYSNENVTIGTQVWGIAKGQSATFTITPGEGHKLLKLLKDGVDVTSSVSNGQYTVSNVQSDFTLEAFFEEGTTPTPQPQTQDKGTAKLLIESFEIKAGETKTMLIDMQNPEDQVTLVQFDLRLPDGLSIASGDDAIDIAGRTTWKKHTLTSNAIDGITRILLYSATNAVIDGTSGAIISIKLVASSSFKGGDIKLENQLMTTPSLVESKPAIYTYNIKGGGDNPPVGDAKPYVVFNNGTLTFYYDKQRSSRQGTKYDLNEGNEKPGWSENANNITSVVFDASFANARPKSTYYWFNGAESLSDIIDIKYLNTSNVTIMSYMFTACSSLTSLDVSNFNTSNVTNMSWMFADCRGLKSLDVSNFNTSNVTNMGGMFDHCRGLKSLDVSNFNTSNVTEMWQMFLGCSGLTSLDVSNFNTSNVTKIQWIFANCSGLTSLDVSNFNTNNVTDMGAMFYGCSGLTSLDVSNFNTDNVTTMHYMFSGCSGLTSLDVSMFNTSNLKNMSEMFLGCSGLTSLDVSNFNTNNVTGMSKMFYNCSGLTTIYVGDKWSTANVTSGEDMFSGCTNLVGGNGTKYDANHTDVEYARIDKAGAPGYFTAKNGGTEPVGDKEAYAVLDEFTLTFYYDDQRSKRGGTIYSLNEGEAEPEWVLDDNNRNVEKVVFDASFAKARPTSTFQWFFYCDYLAEIKGIENLNTSEVKNMRAMFSFCKRLESVDVSHFDTRKVEDMGAMFSNCTKLSSINVSHFNTSNVYNMASMFNNCQSLTDLDLSNFNTNKADYLLYMFSGCNNLKTLYFGSEFTSTNSVSCEEAFADCSNLSKVVFTGDIPASINSTFFDGVGSANVLVKLDVPEQYTANYEAKFNGNMFYGGYFTLREAIVPNDENGGKDYGNGNGEIDENTDLNGSIIGNVYYNIAPENGGYNAAEGCLVVTKPSSDFEGEDPFGDDFKGMFTGIVIMVQPGSGTVKVEAETSGGMSLMVKVGNNQPIKMSFQSKSTLAIPYNVDRPTYVYIYAGGANATRAGSENALKIYSVSWESTASGISACIDDGQPFDVYSLSGTLVKKGARSLKSLPKGAYIVNRRKVMVK